MKIIASVKQEVDLDEYTVKEVFDRELDRLCGGAERYLNEETGAVEEWEDTGHGSGLTYVLDKTPSKFLRAALEFRLLLHQERLKQHKHDVDTQKKKTRSLK